MDEITPGEELESRIMVRFAEQIAVRPEYLAAVLDGYLPITTDLATRIAQALPDTTPEYWIGLQRQIVETSRQTHTDSSYKANVDSVG